MLRETQYEIAKHWDGQHRMRKFDLSGRDLSGLNFANADLHKAKLKLANLNKTNLYSASFLHYAAFIKL
jgi:uncharacterized protein YjbI with pentapeptide repeats